FQAEDGIRDFHVTGVQTCALPICETLLQAAVEEGDHLSWCADRLRDLHSRPSLLNPFWYAGSYALGVAAGLYGDGYNLGFVVERSEERRVGKEWRSGWAPQRAKRK